MGKGKLGPDGYEVSDNNEAMIGAAGEQNAAYRKLQTKCDTLKAENDTLKADLAEATATIEELNNTKAEREGLILAALEGLDHNDDVPWTEEGLPRVEAICAAMGDDTVTRAEVEAALPGYIRSGG